MATSLSAGTALYSLLSVSEELAATATKIFPVWTNEAILPYVAYRRKSLQHNPTKSGAGSDTVQMEVACYAASYEGVVELAEMVRRALDYKALQPSDNADYPPLRGCYLSEALPEAYTGDAYTQTLIFTLNI